MANGQNRTPTHVVCVESVKGSGTERVAVGTNVRLLASRKDPDGWKVLVVAQRGWPFQLPFESIKKLTTEVHNG